METNASALLEASDVEMRLHPTSRRLRVVVNPFTHEGFHFSRLAKAKMLTVSVTLFPVRLLLAAGALLVGAAYTALVSAGVDGTRPPSALRRALFLPTHALARVFLLCLGYWHVPVRVRPGAGGARILVVASQFSFLDAVLMVYLELPCFIAMKAVAGLPFVGLVAKATQTILVDRADPDSRHKTLQAMKERAMQPG